MSWRVCNEPGCGEVTQEPKCKAHQREVRRHSDAKRPSASRRGYDSTHRADRRAYFRAFPLCQHPDGCIAQATDLHHVDGNPFNRSWGNYLGLCHPHHARITSAQQPGGWSA